jgi:hypothetical protein
LAKKARHKLEEAEEEAAFRFPDFDERKFLAHEYEQSMATVLAIAFAVGLAALSWAIVRSGITAAVPWVLGFAGVIGTPFAVQSLRARSAEYTKGDWAWIILTTFFGWLGLWFLFLNLFPG